MRRNLTKLILLLLICTQQICAQPSFQWGKRGGSGGTDNSSRYEHVVDMATDPNGNVYVLAQNALSLSNVDGQPGISTYDLLTLASWDCDGSFRWAKNFGTAGVLIGNAVGTDSLGGVYVSGQATSTNPSSYALF